MIEFVGSYMTEAKWRNEGYVPTIEEHISVAFISTGYKFLLAISLVGMDDGITNDTFEWVSTNPPIVKASCAVCRFMDDTVSHKVHPSFTLFKKLSDLSAIATQYNLLQEICFSGLPNCLGVLIEHPKDFYHIGARIVCFI